MASWSPDALQQALNQAESQKLKAEFDLMATQVHAEELEWSRYLAELAQHQDHERAVVTAAVEAAEVQKEQAVKAHMTSHFCIQPFADRSYLPAFYQGALEAFCKAAPKKEPGQALLINIFNMSVI